ncbi:FAD-dependent monooxygenase [Actinomadura oligospora]|uniref:FAD-dependent monooxygenase n=1 Tax=Actinomadura oligospora TaxID=111804 RepID=UPI0004BB896F|nr:FAD-dependent monooxygenase [Actinomadura oligospora]
MGAGGDAMPGRAGPDVRRVAIVGAGPAGLFAARMAGLLLPGAEVEVHERGAPGEASGFGVTLSARTLGGIGEADPDTHRRIVAASRPLSGIEIVLPGARLRYDGFEVASISRHTLLAILREQAEAVGARIRYGDAVAPDALPDADVVVLADGASSACRAVRADGFGTTTLTGTARFVWLGTDAPFGDRTSFAFVRTPHGPMAAHCYPHADAGGTVVAEMDEATWRAAGFGDTGGDAGEGGASGPLGDDALGRLSEVFAEHLNGRKLVGDRARWSRFTVVTNRRWSDGNTVLLGDAAHTAHFTVGSGTKLALEDAIALASALAAHPDRTEAFAAYERARRGPVERTQRLAFPSMRWWESFGRRLDLPPEEFGLHFLTRTAAMTHAALRRRCPDRLAEAEAAYRRAAGDDRPGDARPGHARHAVDTPLRLGSTTLPDRVVPLPATGPRLHELWCPEDPDWSENDVPASLPDADADADGILVRTQGPAWERWHETVRYAAAIRAAHRLPVAVQVPADWREGPGLDADEDTWSARIHLALLAGRIDLIAVTAGL